MGGAIVQVRVALEGGAGAGSESSAWPLGVHGASGHSCLGGRRCAVWNSEEVRAGASYGQSMASSGYMKAKIR